MSEVAKINCEGCKGTGFIEVESIDLGRPQYKQGHLIYPMQGKGDWHLATCYCLSDDDDNPT